MNKFFRKKSIQKILSDTSLDAHGPALSKTLGVRDLVAFGIAAIIGAGIFSTIGKASASGGPGVVFLFLFTALACGFTALAYAEFASLIPVSGSAYTYSYVAFGELFAWVIGWALIMEYAIGNITVAISWSDYFTGFMSEHLHCRIPAWLSTDYITAKNAYAVVSEKLADGATLDMIKNSANVSGKLEGYYAYLNAPAIGSFRIILDLPAMLIVAAVTYLLFRGMKESRMASNIMVVVKLLIVLLVIVAGIAYINPENYTPFMPEGVSGVLSGISAVFFAYIGFDAISTTAEECKNPQRDLPRAILWSIVICTVLYILIALVITGLVNYSKLDVGDPLAYVLTQVPQLEWLSFFVGISAIVAMASVLLVFQMGQPRIWMAMSRDGLLPKQFAKIHPKFKSPSTATIITGLLVGLPVLFIDLDLATNLCSIGTLFAFVLVCGGVLKLQHDPLRKNAAFKIPFVNGRYFLPIVLALVLIPLFYYNGSKVGDFLSNAPVKAEAAQTLDFMSDEQVTQVKSHVKTHGHKAFEAVAYDLEAYLDDIGTDKTASLLAANGIDTSAFYYKGWNLFFGRFPFWIFIVVGIIITMLTIVKQYSLIPVLGLLCCLYMMSELGASNWIAFGLWLMVGLLIYFTYSARNSKLRETI